MPTDWRVVEQAVAAIPAEVGFWARRLEEGDEWAHDAERQFSAASTVKVAVLIELFRRIEAGERRLDERLALEERHRARGSGVLRELDAGLRPTLRDLATLMIVISDNTATNMCIDLAGGFAGVSSLLRDLGLDGTTLNRYMLGRAVDDPAEDNLTTARDLGRMLELIWRGQAASAESCRQMLAILARQQERQRLPRLFPDEAKHHGKTGTVSNRAQDWQVRHDCSLALTPNGPVAIACLTLAPLARDGAEVDAAIGRVGLAVLEAIGAR
jgi:beta-lactamase class A